MGSNLWSWQTQHPSVETEKHGSGRLDAVDGVPDVELFVNRSPFAGRDVAATETGRHALVDRGMRQQISGQLLNGELVVRLIGIERPDQPVAVRPDRPFIVQMQAVRIAVAGRVEPIAGHLLAVLG